MKLAVLLFCLVTVQAAVIKEEVIINGVRHEKEILHDNLDHPSRLVMDYKTNDLYFSIKNKDEHYTAKINVNTGEFKRITMRQAFTHTIDHNTQELYTGGFDGIYKYNVITDKSQYIGAFSGSLTVPWNMFYKNQLYYVELPSSFLYTLVDGRSIKLAHFDHKVNTFVIDNDDFIYFSYLANFYRQKKGTNDTEVIEGIPYVTALNTDKNGHVYACASIGIYKAVEHSTRFVIVVDDIFPIGIAFDGDNNIIYSDRNKIIRLKPIV